MVIFSFTVFFGTWLMLYLPGRLGGGAGLLRLASDVTCLGGCLAYGVAVWLYVVIAEEHRSSRLMQAAWLALAANAGFSVLRTLAESRWPHFFFPAYFEDQPLRGLWQQVAIFLANLSLTVGVVLMWLAFDSVGLSVRLKRRDYLAIGLILCVLALLPVVSGGFTEARSPYLLARYIQRAGAPFWVLYSVLSVILHRMVGEMGGGRLQLALRCIVFYVMARGALILLSSGARLAENAFGPRWYTRLALELDTVGWQFLRWLPALAAAYRIQMSACVVERLNLLKQARSANAAAT